MGLIINDKIQMLMKGYPTVSDKYNVAGAVLEGDTPVQFGQLVKFGATAGYFAPATNMASVSEAAGFVVATNVKLAEGFPGTLVQVNPGEAFNLLVNGFMAIELDSEATLTSVTANSSVAVILATGALTTSDKIDDNTIVALPNVVFTGTVENHGTTANPVYYAEIYVK